MKLRYTRTALAELDALLTFIEEESPRGARRVRSRIRAVTELLTEFPNSGRATSNPRLRRVLATPFPYAIFYESTGDEVVVIAVRHTARDPGSMPGADRR